MSMAHQVNVAELFSLLESGKPNEVEEVKTLIHENLNATKESWLLNGLVDYYMLTQSSRCLDILVGIREPHDKHLFDKLSDSLKGQNRKNSILLLSHLIRKQPSWLYKMIQHRVMHTFLNILKTDTDVPNLLSALLTLITLLPLLPSMIGPFLPDLFEIFSRLAAWNFKKPANIPEVFLLHLHVGVYALFHRLYALYPCNFLAYLRSYYGARDHSRENFDSFKATIKPMLERVRLHPLLVTASKETELSSSRWRTMEIHDIIVDCAKVSLDPIEGVREDLDEKMFNVSPASLPQLTAHLLSTEYMHPLINAGHSERAPFSFEDTSLVRRVTRVTQISTTTTTSSSSGSFIGRESTQSVPTPIWSPSRACGLETPPPVLQQQQQSQHISSLVSLDSESLQGPTSGSPPDIAQEALPESSPPKTKANIVSSVITQSSCEALPSSVPLVHSTSVPTEVKTNTEEEEPSSQLQDVCSGSKSDELGESIELVPRKSEASKDVDNTSLNLSLLMCGDSLQTEPREEGVDNEVSEIVGCLSSSSQADCTQEPGHMTPFFSTTCYLTAAPDEEPTSADMNRTSDGNLVSESQAVSEASSSSLVQQFVHNINRLRYFSQCAPQLPDVPIECPRSYATGLRRSRSCPTSVSELPCQESSLIEEKNLEQPVMGHSEVTTSACLTTSSVFTTISVDQRTENLSVVATSADSLVSSTAISSTQCVQHQTSSEDNQQSTEVSIGRSSPPSLTSSALGDQSGSLTSCFLSGDLTRTVSSISRSSLTYPQPWPSSADASHPTPTTSFNHLSPLEALDLHLKLGNDVYLKELRSVPLTSTRDTDWTHFGGSPPPDEVNILRGQISLLHSQLLYERYKREIHAERNRRLLGRAKKARALEEQNSAMKDQLQLQEDEIQNKTDELSRYRSRYLALEKEKKLEYDSLHKRISDLTKENEDLKALAMKNESLLALSKQEQEDLHKTLQEIQSQLFELTQEMKTYQQQANRSKQLSEEVDNVNRQLMLLGELYRQCRNKLDDEKPQRTFDQEQEMMKEAMQSEIAGLKALTESKNAQLESSKARAESLEVVAAEKDLAMNDLKQLLETVKDKHKFQLQAERDRISGLIRLNQQQEAYILELQDQLFTKERLLNDLTAAKARSSNGEGPEMDAIDGSHITSTEPTFDHHHSQLPPANDQNSNSAEANIDGSVEIPPLMTEPQQSVKPIRSEKPMASMMPAIRIDQFKNLELLLDKGDQSDEPTTVAASAHSGHGDSQVQPIAAELLRDS